MVVASFVAGIWWAFTPGITPFIRPSLGVAMILAGLVLLSPFATSRPINDEQRRVRMRISAMGGGNVVYGVAQLVPSVRVSTLLMVLTVLLMAAAASGFQNGCLGPDRGIAVDALFVSSLFPLQPPAGREDDVPANC